MQKKRVRIVETGQVFESKEALSIYLGKTKNWVSRVMNGQRLNTSGLTFEDTDLEPTENGGYPSGVEVNRISPACWEVRRRGDLVKTFKSKELAEIYASDSVILDAKRRKYPSEKWGEVKA